MGEDDRHLTETKIKAAKPRKGRKRRKLWDDDPKGLLLEVLPSGTKKFRFHYKHKGRSRWYTISTWQPEQGALANARRTARGLKIRTEQGVDVLAEEQAEERRSQEAKTVADLAVKVINSHASRRSPSTRRMYESLFRLYVVPALGDQRVEEVTWEDFATLHRRVLEGGRWPVYKVESYTAEEAKESGASEGDVREFSKTGKTHALDGGGHQANRMLAVASKAWTLAARWGLWPRRVPNPAKNHDRAPERRDVGDPLTAAELTALGKHLPEPGSHPQVDAFLFFLLTGARPVDVRRMTWADVHPDGRRVRLAESKTGPRTLYLGAVPAAILARQPKGEAADYVFRSVHFQNKGGQLYDLRYHVEPAFEAAKLDARRYDCRHGFVSRGYELGLAEHVIRKLSGHAVGDLGGAHGRYRHTSVERLLEAADSLSESLWGDLYPKGKKAAPAKAKAAAGASLGAVS